MNRRWLYPVFLMLFWLAAPGRAPAQDSLRLQGNLRQKYVPVRDSLVVDSLSVSRTGFSVSGIPDTDYLIYPERALLVWKRKPATDSVQLRYRVLPLSFSAVHRHKRRDIIDSSIAFPFYTYTPGDPSDASFVDFNSIDYNGTYGRSLTIGNRQDVSLNSNFNLQLNGYILDSIRVEAALTDNNIPFQPDGNTQQIQEFDKIYITFEKGYHKLTAGDYELSRPNSYFMNFDKRVQGLFYQGTVPAGKHIRNRVGLSASVAKGEFARNVFNGQEGNQGPYKLTGNNGEQFFIVLAGSEKVYIDGMLMERGEDRDYVIDYNTAEVTFMPRRMITKDRRIQVEFEYQARNYLNTLFYVYDELNIGKKWALKFHAYSNQDARNQPYVQNLTGAQKRFLAGIGDNIDQAFYQSLQQDTFAANKILYKMTDTTVSGIRYDSVFVYSTNPDSALYTLGFSYVGEQKGNYIISGMNTNGRSYSWIAPSGGVPQGNYAPVVLLVTPKQQQMFTLGSTYQIDSFKKVSLELAASNYAPNLFSSLDKAQHWGFAGKAGYEETRFFGKKDSLGQSPWSLQSALYGEQTQKNFRPIAPFRNVEFSRDWNLADDSSAADENLITLQTALKRKDLGSLKYSLTWYRRGAFYQASRNIVNLLLDHGGLKGGAVFNLMESKDALQQTAFLRPSAFLEKTFPKTGNLTLGARWEEERNAIRILGADTLSPAAYAYDQLSFYMHNGDEDKTRFTLNYTLRQDQKAGRSDFLSQGTSHTLEGSLLLTQWKGQQVTFTGAYRQLVTDDTALLQARPDGRNVLARLQYEGSILHGFLVPSVLYEIGSGQQQKQEYIYVEVPAGQGMYMWNDYNGDGVQQSNEFEPALYPDQKKYIRVITPTNDYVQVNYVTLNHSLQVSPENLWTGKHLNGWQRFAGRFSDQLSLQISNHVLADAGLTAFNPFAHSITDDDIIANATSISNTLFFNQRSAVWGLEYNYLYNSGKSLLTYGLESNGQQRNSLKSRWVFLKSFTLNLTGQQDLRSYQSAVPGDGRTYAVSGRVLQPELTWLQPSLLRITGGYKWDKRDNNAAYGGETALIQSVSLNLRLTFPKMGSVEADGTYSGIGYNGKNNTPLSFVMLDALQPGANWLWHLSWERRIGKGIEISLEYEGRKPGNTPVIHTGTMSIRAIL